jgi:integrase
MPKGLPSLRKHKIGHFFWRENGKDHYAGRDLTKAETAWRLRFSAELGAQAQGLALPLGASVPDGGQRTAVTPSRRLRTVQETTDRFLEQVEAQCSPERSRVYRYELAPFLSEFGSRPIDSLTPDELLSFRAKTIRKYKPWTSNGRLSVLRRVLAMADTLGWLERPYRTAQLLKGVPIGETKPKAWTPEEVRAKIGAVAKKNPQLARRLRLQWLCCLRPFSVARVIEGEGTWEGEGVFALAKSKTEAKVGERQRLCLSPAAMEELKKIQKGMYLEGPLYRVACVRAGFGAPHALRHSAATALANAGVTDELIETALGHSLPRVKRTYRPQGYQQARAAMALLAELVPEIEVLVKEEKVKTRKAA